MEHLDEYIEKLKQVEGLAEIVAPLIEEVYRLRTEVESLRNQLNKNSTNSSKPPSSDGFKRVVKNNRQFSGRKQGGQPGHKGTTLEFSDKVDHSIITELAPSCSCGCNLRNVEVERWKRRQCFDLPQHIKVEVTEYKIPVIHCPSCGKQHEGQAPVSAPVSYGPHISSLATYLNQYQLIPFERLQELFEDVFQHKLSDGFLQKCNEHHYNVLERSEQYISESLQQSECLGADETSVRCLAKNQWIHTATNQQFTHYHANPSRGSKAMREAGILSEFKSVVVHDRYSSYDKFDFTHALCGAHLLRDLKFLFEEKACSWAKEFYNLLIWAKDYKQTGLLNTKDIKDFESRYDTILQSAESKVDKAENNQSIRGRPKQSPERNLLNVFINRKQDVLRFLYHNDVPFDNNQAERDLRMIKLQQKISGGFRSLNGLKIFCRIRTYIATAKKQGYKIMDALTKAFKADPYFVPST